ncbi:MAG: AsmA family protein [Candidatus Omnitrophica bacterium]|nr:AsmA family protein [Candidatus Omnitrophota bacterium]
MKKFLIGVIVVVFLAAAAVAALAAFILTYDINGQRPLIESKISQAVGHPATISRVHWKLGLGVTVQVDGFKINDETRASGAPLLECARLEAAIDLVPLLWGNLRLGTILLVDPRAEIIRTPDGQFVVRGVDLPQASPSRPQTAAETTPQTAVSVKSGPKLQSVHINKLKIENGRIRFTDQNPEFPLKLDVQKVDLSLDNITLDGAAFDISAALVGPDRNFDAKGSIDGISLNRPRISRASVHADLGAVDLVELERQIPKSREWAIGPALDGKLTLEVPEALFAANQMERLDSRLRLENGIFQTASLRSPVRDIQLDAGVDTETLNLRNFSAQFFGGGLKASGTVNDYMKTPRSRLKAALKDIHLADALAAAGQTTRLDGVFSADFDGTAAGTTWDQISRTLSGKGSFILNNGVILNGNPLKELLSKLSVIPGFDDAVQKQVPESVKNRINAPTTPILKPLQHNFVITDGIMRLDHISVPTELFNVESDMVVDLRGQISGTGSFIIGQAVTQPIIEGASELSYLASGDGIISIPVRYAISKQAFSILPDLGSFSARAVMEKGQALIQGFMDKALQKTPDPASVAPAQDGVDTGAGTAQPQSSSPLADLLRSEIEKLRER